MRTSGLGCWPCRHLGSIVNSERRVVVVPATQWDLWHQLALGVRVRRSQATRWSFALITVVMVGVSVAVLSGPGRYAALVYSPVVGLFVAVFVGRIVVAFRFGRSADAMRVQTIPALISRATNGELLHLAAGNRVVVDNSVVVAREQDSDVYIEAKVGGIPSGLFSNWAIWAGAGSS